MTSSMLAQGYIQLCLLNDTNHFISGNNTDIINREINCEMNKIYNWFTANKLGLNLDKTCYMLFKPKNKEICDSAIKICIGNHDNKNGELHQISWSPN